MSIKAKIINVIKNKIIKGVVYTEQMKNMAGKFVKVERLKVKNEDNFYEVVGGCLDKYCFHKSWLKFDNKYRIIKWCNNYKVIVIKSATEMATCNCISKARLICKLLNENERI